MNKPLENRIIEMLDRHKICTLATIEGDKPRVRYMALFHEGLTIYLATDRKTHKVEELEHNPNVHILLGFERGSEGGGDILGIEGTGQVTKNDALREKIWNDEFKKYFEGPHDPSYVILEIAPQRIELARKDAKAEVWEKQ